MINYSLAVGQAAEDYLSRFPYAHPLPAQWRWGELFDVMVAAAPQQDDAIYAELERAIAKFPTWPTDPLHAIAVVNEEVGEAVKAVLQAVYEPHKSGPDEVRAEAIQAAAMAIRFVRSLDAYVYTAGPQHKQGGE